MDKKILILKNDRVGDFFHSLRNIQLIREFYSNHKIEIYLSKITDEALYAYNVYQIEGEGRNLFLKIEGDEDTIMGLPIKKIKEYLNITQ